MNLIIGYFGSDSIDNCVALMYDGQAYIEIPLFIMNELGIATPNYHIKSNIEPESEVYVSFTKMDKTVHSFDLSGVIQQCVEQYDGMYNHCIVALLETSNYLIWVADDKSSKLIYPNNDKKELSKYSLELQSKLKHFTYKYCFSNQSTGLCDKDDMMTGYEVSDVQLREYRYDGTYEQSNPNYLFEYHSNSIPKKLQICWTYGSNEYSAYFWFIDIAIISFFNRVYGLHANTKTDIQINAMPDAKKYELSLYRQGLKEPVVIPESAYQLIVFKNKFEDYRSENYNQPSGAWIW